MYVEENSEGKGKEGRIGSNERRKREKRKGKRKRNVVEDGVRERGRGEGRGRGKRIGRDCCSETLGVIQQD